MYGIAHSGRSTGGQTKREFKTREKTLQETAMESWRAFLDLCIDSQFRQIVLIDEPNILGRERWLNSAVTIKVRQKMLNQFNGMLKAKPN